MPLDVRRLVRFRLVDSPKSACRPNRQLSGSLATIKAADRNLSIQCQRACSEWRTLLRVLSGEAAGVEEFQDRLGEFFWSLQMGVVAGALDGCPARSEHGESLGDVW